ncbi:hypothetical protein NL676_015286 [Syzygium grande]|nr:hypothetical protein NL676_015286 [Syzygium grande]
MNADSDFHSALPPTHEIITSFASIPTTNSSLASPRKKRARPIQLDPNLSVPSPSSVSRPDECGKKFWSWKALFGHMRCHAECQWRGMNPPTNFQPVGDSPAKSSSSTVVDHGLMTEEDHEVAMCLLMLANKAPMYMDSPCAATANEGHRNSDAFPTGDARMGVDHNADGGGRSDSNCQFECSSCKKVFGSHQALGGTGQAIRTSRAVSQWRGVVTVSICLKVFSSGQALGGHKRCHWEKGEEPFLAQGLDPFVTKEPPLPSPLDLNLPASAGEDLSSSCFSDLTLDLRLGI